MNWNSQPKIALSAKFELYQVIILKIIQDSLFFNPKNDVTHCKQKVAMATSDYINYWQNMQMTVNGVKLKSESFFSISPGIFELWRKTLGGADSAPWHG